MTTLTVVHCAEDALAAGVSQCLLERLLAAEAPLWFRDLLDDPATRDATLGCVGLDGQAGWTKDIEPALAQTRAAHPRLRFHPRCGGNAAKAYLSFRIASLLDLEGSLLLLLLAFDTDHNAEDVRCAAGVAEARQHVSIDVQVVIAEASPEFDAWVLGGFSPKNTHEEDRLAQEREILVRAGHHIHPVREHHLLTSNVKRKGVVDPRDAKKLCERLLDLSSQACPTDSRVIDCLDVPLAALETTGALSGLAEFLSQARLAIQALLPG